jgi:hypothetical protein
MLVMHSGQICPYIRSLSIPTVASGSALYSRDVRPSVGLGLDRCHVTYCVYWNIQYTIVRVICPVQQ